jgi:DNA polymerase III alpha subunit
MFLDKKDKEDKVNFEKELLSSQMSEHLTKVARRNYPNPGELVTLKEMKDKANNEDVKVIVVITNIESMITQEGDLLVFPRLEDDTSIVVSVVFYETYKNVKDLLRKDVVLLITGKTDNKWKDRPQLLIVDKIESLGRLN